jgi:hypothetical protein
VGVGGVEQVLGELGGELGLLFLDFLEARLLRVGQLGAGEAEVAQRVLEDALAHRRQGGELGAVVQGLVLLEQREVLPDLGIEARDLGQHRVVGLAPLGHVEHAVQVADHAPGAAEALAGLFHRCDEAVPARGRGVGGEAFDERTILVDEAADRGLDVLGPDVGEARHAGEVEQGIGVGSGRGNGRGNGRAVVHLRPCLFVPASPGKAAILPQKRRRAPRTTPAAA